MAWRSPRSRPKTSGARTKRFFGHWVGRIERTRGTSTAGIVWGVRVLWGLRHETSSFPLYRPPPPAPRLDRPAARPRQRDSLPARHLQRPPADEVVGGGVAAPRNPPPDRPLAGRRPAARRQPQRRPLLSRQPPLPPRLAHLGAQRPFLAPPPPRPLRLRLDGEELRPPPRGGLGGSGLLHGERLLPLPPLLLQPDRRRRPGSGPDRRGPGPRRPRASAVDAAGGRPGLGAPPPRRRPLDGPPCPLPCRLRPGPPAAAAGERARSGPGLRRRGRRPRPRRFGGRQPRRGAADRRVPAYPAALLSRPLGLYQRGRDRRQLGPAPGRGVAASLPLRPSRPGRTGELLGRPLLHRRAALLPLPLPGPSRPGPRRRRRTAAAPAAGRAGGCEIGRA